MIRTAGQTGAERVYPRREAWKKKNSQTTEQIKKVVFIHLGEWLSKFSELCENTGNYLIKST